MIDGVDVLFNTFAKSMAGIGAFVSSEKIYRGLPALQHAFADLCESAADADGQRGVEASGYDPQASGIQGQPLDDRPHALQSGFRKRGFDIGGTLSPVTPVYMKGGWTRPAISWSICARPITCSVRWSCIR